MQRQAPYSQASKTPTLFPYKDSQFLLNTHNLGLEKKMATVTTQASAAVFRPCSSKARFLTGSSAKLNREVSLKALPSTSSPASFKVEAKKGEWLPGLASPGYLNGRY